jgi:hypothetical protein
MAIWVEVHPWTALGLPKRWRVMYDGVQHSVHETETEAEAAAAALRQRVAGGGTGPTVKVTDSSNSPTGPDASTGRSARRGPR